MFGRVEGRLEALSSGPTATTLGTPASGPTTPAATKNNRLIAIYSHWEGARTHLPNVFFGSVEAAYQDVATGHR